MADEKRITSAVLKALGLTGAMIPAVSCGPCLDYAVVDTANSSDDTGDSGEDDTGGSSEDASAAVSEAVSPVGSVLERGVLPEDVAAILARRRSTEP